MIGLEPDLIWRCQDGAASINRRAPDPASRFVPEEHPPLESLRALIAESALPLADDLPPMAAGLFGYLGYDMVRLMERLPEPNPDALGVPDAILIRPTIMVVFDAVQGRDLGCRSLPPAGGHARTGGLRERHGPDRERGLRP
jgi:anthranilate synthase component 1